MQSKLLIIITLCLFLITSVTSFINFLQLYKQDVTDNNLAMIYKLLIVSIVLSLLTIIGLIIGLFFMIQGKSVPLLYVCIVMLLLIMSINTVVIYKLQEEKQNYKLIYITSILTTVITFLFSIFLGILVTSDKIADLRCNKITKSTEPQKTIYECIMNENNQQDCNIVEKKGTMNGLYDRAKKFGEYFN